MPALPLQPPAAGRHVWQVASFVRSRVHGVSNLNAVTDGLRVLEAICSERAAGRRPVPAVPANVIAFRGLAEGRCSSPEREA